MVTGTNSMPTGIPNLGGDEEHFKQHDYGAALELGGWARPLSS